MTRPVIASIASTIRLKCRIVVIVTVGWRQRTNGGIAAMAFVVFLLVGLERPNGTIKAMCVPGQFWRRYWARKLVSQI